MSSETVNPILNRDSAPPMYWKLIKSAKALFSNVKRVSLHTQLDIVGMGVAGALTVMIILSLPLSPAPLVVGLVAYGVYVGDRISDISDDPDATADRIEFMREHKQMLSISSAGAYGLAIAISLFGGPLALAITLIPGASWVVYASDWVSFSGAPLQKLKGVFVLNSSMVAFAWATAMVFLPITFADASMTPVALILGVYFFVDIFINTEIPNVRDRLDDAQNGVSTFPTVLGVERTRHVLYLINVLLILFLIGAVFSQYLSVIFAAILLIGRSIAVGLNYFVGRIDDYRRLEMVGEMTHVLVVGLLIGLVFS